MANRSIGVMEPFRSRIKPDGVRANCVEAGTKSLEPGDDGVLRSCDIVYTAWVQFSYAFDESGASANRSSGFVVDFGQYRVLGAGKVSNAARQ